MGILAMLGFGHSKIKAALRSGAVIIDVRTAHEFDQGKVRGSINIPMDRLTINLQRIRQLRQPIVICSDSESKNEKAINLLKANGVKEILNGGTWTRMLKITKSV